MTSTARVLRQSCTSLLLIPFPAIFNYVILKQGSANYFINKSDEKSEVYNITEDPDQLYKGTSKFFVVNTNNIIKHWVMKDVPAMQLQDYSSSIENYISKLEFQLSEYRFPDQPFENKMKDWDMVSVELLKYDDFGISLMYPKIFLDFSSSESPSI